MRLLLRSLDTLEVAKESLDSYLDRKDKAPFFLGAVSIPASKSSFQSSTSATSKPKGVSYQADKIYACAPKEGSIPKAHVNLGKASSLKSTSGFTSKRAEKILSRIRKKNVSVVKSDVELRGKPTLAYMVWALGAAQDAKIAEGISVHDAATLLQGAASIKLYPVNLSRLVHHHSDLIELASQEKKTKRYRLTPKGQKAWKNLVG